MEADLPASQPPCRVVSEFALDWIAKNSPSSSPTPKARPPSPKGRAKSPSSPKTINPLRRFSARSTSPARERAAGPRFSQSQFVSACDEMEAFSDSCFKGVCIVGNGRSVLAQSAGPMVDRFETVLRFNDFGSEGYEAHVGSKTSLWVMSDWTIVKLLNKYPERTLPVLCAIPYRFMGKPYYDSRRAELEEQLTDEQLARVTFISSDTARGLIEGRNFGDRWPSSGLLTIMHVLETARGAVRLHGFDFFKQIDGKIHYMEDTHTANHHAAEEERLVMAHVKERRVNFLN